MIKRTVFTLTAFALVTFGVGLASGFAQTVDEIVARHYATKGGPEKWKAIQTLKITGVAWGQGTEVGMAIYNKRPNLSRQEVTIQIPGQPGFTIVSVFDGAKAWQNNPMAGSDALQEVSGAEAESIKDQADFDSSLLDYRAKGHTVEFVGAEMVGLRKVHHLKVTRKGLPAQHFYLDAESGLELQNTTEAGVGPASVTEFSDYRSVNGVQVAHLVRFSQNGTLVGELRVSTVEFNTPIDDAWFKGR
jgi:hypothetical protein